MPGKGALLGAALALTGAVADVRAEEAPRLRALLIGIGDYQSADFGDLRGPLNDLLLIHGVLTSRLGFPADDVQLLPARWPRDGDGRGPGGQGLPACRFAL